MRSLIFDPSYGCAGDMILGAFVAAGVPFAKLQSELEKLNLPGYKISHGIVHRSDIAAIKVNVETAESSTHRHLRHIVEIIDASSLSDAVKENSKRVFGRLAEAEAEVHSSSPDEVHFHEVGAVDAIVDIVGACICIESLDVGEIYSRPIALGSGTITCDHGIFPVPAPATVNLVKGFPTKMYSINAELTTPTGAAIITAAAEPLYSGFDGSVVSVGYGAGSRSFEDHPNLMRVFVTDDADGYDRDTVVELRTNIDDMNPQVYSHLFDRLFEAGALDVHLTSVQMKKNRPGQLLTVICEPEKQDALRDEIFLQTSTSGVRYQTYKRVKLPRSSEMISTPLGDCDVKVFEFSGGRRVVPEYESVKKIAASREMSYLDAHDVITKFISEMEKEQ
jgi:uncharacterized protein (TIGR00299 family) protein